MSEKYDEYLNNHINAVNECYRLLTRKELRDYNSNIITHDKSKYYNDEYDAYDEYFYPSDGSKVGEDPKRKEAFQYAWLHHQNTNPHHWQYWVLIQDDGTTKPMNIPEKYIKEMIADWSSFAYLNKRPEDLTEWYASHREKQRSYAV